MAQTAALLSQYFFRIQFFDDLKLKAQEISWNLSGDALEIPQPVDDILGFYHDELSLEESFLPSGTQSDELFFTPGPDPFTTESNGVSLFEITYQTGDTESQTVAMGTGLAFDEIPQDGSSMMRSVGSLSLMAQTASSSVVSAFFHVFVIFAISYTAYASPVGQQGGRHEPIFVSLVDPQSSIICITSRGSADSAPSLPSIADRSKDNEARKEREGVATCDKGEAPNETGEISQPENATERSDQRMATFVDSGTETSRKSANRDNIDYSSKSMKDSVASVASIGQAEKYSASTRGDEIHEFKLKLLAAIHEVAYFPKNALRTRKFGEVLLSFTLADNGHLEDLRVSKTSGSEILDEAALEILRKAAEKFPKIPEQSLERKLTYAIPITFRK